MNKELKSIFGEAITVGGASVPTAHIRYKGKETTFVTWVITGTRPALNADDDPLYCVSTVDVDVYGKGNILSVLAEVKRLMNINEWIWTEDSPEMYEDDTGLYHITASFEKERAI